VQQDLDAARFYKLFVELMRAGPVSPERVQ
jgi:hypothetical protein